MLLMDCLTPVLVDGLFATLGINNRKAKQLVNCQNPFPGLFFLQLQTKAASRNMVPRGGSWEKDSEEGRADGPGTVPRL